MPRPPLPVVAVGAAELAETIDGFLSGDAQACLVLAIPLSGFELDDAQNIISEAEHAQAARFLHSEDRLRFVLGRAILRSVLSRILTKKAATKAPGLSFHVGDYGKLSLPDSIQFNLSHSGQLVLIGLHRGTEIGVDVEAIRPLADWPHLAETYLAAAERALIDRSAIEDRNMAFLQAWTRKEAVAKALGLGLSLPLASFAILPSGDAWGVATSAGSLHGRACACFDLALDKHHVGAVALASKTYPKTYNCRALTSSSAAALSLAVF